MATNTTSDTAIARAAKMPLSGKNKAGLVLGVILGLGDVSNLASIGQTLKPGEDGPPVGVVIVSAVLGVISIVAVVIAWRSRSRAASRVLVGSRVLSLILSLPAFFVSGVPAGWVVLTAVAVVLTLLCIWLVLAKPATP